MFFEVALVPKDLIIEAENEDELKKITKRITIESLIWTTSRINKDKFKVEMKSRFVYLKDRND